MVKVPGPTAQRLAAVAAAVAVAALFYFRPEARPSALMRDFNAFYCAGAALDRGADPYRAEPLGSCERAPRPAWLNRAIPNLSAPAPLPPYALAPFAALARLPYVFAAIAWSIVILLAFLVTVAVMRRLTNLPFAAIAAAFVLGDGYAAGTLGQVAPIAVAAIALAAYFVAHDRPVAATAAVAFATIEPHLALPVALALFLWYPRARIALVLAGVTLGAISIAVGGWQLNLEYLRQVLPAHALSELANSRQLSLASVLHRIGASDALALRIGEFSYAAMLAFSLWAAPVVARRTACPALVVTLPVALTLVGGPFGHVVQVAAALPCALLLYRYVPSARVALGLAIVALSIPWVQFSSLGSVLPVAAAAVTAALVATLVDRRPIAIAITALGTLGIFEAISLLVTQRVPDASKALAAAYDPHALAQASWTLYVGFVGPWNLAAFDLARLPTWLGLLAVAFVGARVAIGAPGLQVPAPPKRGYTSHRPTEV
jgi:hypothetical protein